MPPPTSTTVSPSRQSRRSSTVDPAPCGPGSSRGRMRRGRPDAPRATTRSRCRTSARTALRPAQPRAAPAARCQTPPKRCAKSLQPSPRQQLGRLRVAKDAVLGLGEDPVARRARAADGEACPRPHRPRVRAPRPAAALPRVRPRCAGRRRSRAPASPARRAAGPRPPSPAGARSSPRGADRGGGLGQLVVGERAAVEQEPPVADDPDDRRIACPQRRGELLLDRARVAPQLRERQRAAADARDGLLDGLRRRAARAARRGRARPRPAPRASAAPESRSRRVEVELKRPLERGERELVRAQRALERVAPEPLDEVARARRRSRPAARRAACRPRSRRGPRRLRGRRARSGSSPSAHERRPSRGRRRAAARVGARRARAPRAAAAR